MESHHDGYRDILVLLAAAGLVVPLFHRLRINPVLGYLIAGALVGPDGLGRLADTVPALSYVTVSSPQAVALFGELGVALLLFMIGIEVSLQRLVTMRRLVFGLGGAQVVVTAAALAGGAVLLGLAPTAALIVGLALALSSTAIVVELLSRQKRMHGAGGRATFAVLLFQDLAVIPALLLISILSRGGGDLASGFGLALAQSMIAGLLIVVVGRFGLRPLLRLAAKAGGADVFLAASLFAIVAVAIAAQAAGLSMTFGAFVAGLLIAETEFRREVETIIEPFKGLFLGLFFIAIGMAIDLDAIAAHPFVIVSVALAVIAAKAAIMAGLGGAFRLPGGAIVETSLLLAPCGEFGFVIMAAAVPAALIGAAEAAIAVAVIAATMIALPVLSALSVIAAPRAERLKPAAGMAEPPPADPAARVIVCGYGRVGQLIGSILDEHKIPFIAVDADVDVVARARREGRPVYFGDASRGDFLQNCGIGSARALVVTMDSAAKVQRVVEIARPLRADVPIVARAHDDRQALSLYGLGVTAAVPETIEASLQLGEALLDELGIPMGVAIASIHERRDEFRRKLGWIDRRRRATLASARKSSTDV
ncbi:MAG: cation:proton antiporter [Hyphomicrobiales bacterium]